MDTHEKQKKEQRYIGNINISKSHREKNPCVFESYKTDIYFIRVESYFISIVTN